MKLFLKESPTRITIGILSVTVILLTLTGCTSVETEVPSPLAMTSGTHYIPIEDLGDASPYWNVNWQGRSSQLYDRILNLTVAYSHTHEYVSGETDCNDMAIDAWRELLDIGIMSIIAVGNLEKSNESFLECNHAWLMVYCGEGSAAVMDLVRGKVHIWEEVRRNPQLRQYWEGFVYEKPSDLFADFEERW